MLLVFTSPSSHVLHSQSWEEGMGGLEVGPFFGYQY